MSLPRFTLLLVASALLSPFPVRADEPVPTLEDERKKAQELIVQDTAGEPRTAARVAEVVQLRLEEGQLIVRTNQGPTEARQRIKIADLPGLTLLDVRSAEAKDELHIPMLLSLVHWDFAKPGQIVVNTTIMWMPDRLNISRDSESLVDQSTLTLSQSMQAHEDDQPGVSLRVNRSSKINEADAVRLVISAPSFEELITRYPRETALYLEPIFQDLRQAGSLFAIDSKLAWQVFADALKPDAAMLDKIHKLIMQLDADAYADRDAASAELEKLGQPAAGWISRMDRSKLSPEQRSRIDLFLANYHPLDPAHANALREDVNFLLNCLYSEEQPIRKQAILHLKAVTNKPIDFDIHKPAPERSASIVRLRAQLMPAATQPSTAPTGEP